jgi:hypothetical protein
VSLSFMRMARVIRSQDTHSASDQRARSVAISQGLFSINFTSILTSCCDKAISSNEETSYRMLGTHPFIGQSIKWKIYRHEISPVRCDGVILDSSDCTD